MFRATIDDSCLVNHYQCEVFRPSRYCQCEVLDPVDTVKLVDIHIYVYVYIYIYRPLSAVSLCICHIRLYINSHYRSASSTILLWSFMATDCCP